ncbi:hypothetical protein PTKIN_Ptkin12aG0021500 [Pterospermum kingtungense]
MPTNLYYTPASDEGGIPFLGQGQGNLYTLGNDSALEMVYRVSIGGWQISSANDTGMFRSWSDDYDYLTVAKPGALPVNASDNLTFSNIPSFSAPGEIYVTARTVGTNKTENENYDLTWEFPVDSGFNYFVRLHFCEFQRDITEPGDRVFEIFLANITAESQADVIVWVVEMGFQRSNKFANNTSPALPSDICRYFSLKEIKTATNNFDENFIIGRGGFGDVYKGFINLGFTPVAIKRLSPGSKQGVLEFRTEIKMLSQLRHQNLVSLIGNCKEKNEMILVYDYMIHGTLRDHLYNTSKPPLPWKQRLRICIGAAQGIHYLHTGPNHTIIHRDVKTTNILLDEKWVAKVSDFGLSKMNDMSDTHISTAVKGSFGYLDPEYYRLQRLTEKSDVYSFGVVLCEVLCARAPIDRSGDHIQISLANWAQHCYDNGTLAQIIDPHLQGNIRPPSLSKFSEVAISCLASEGNKRPAMSDVVCGLELALRLQGSEVNGNDENHVNDSTVIDYHVLFTSGSGSMKVGR